MNRFLLSLLMLLALFLGACHRVSEKIEPQVSYAVQDRYLKQLPSPFTPLSLEERSQDWGKEYQIGLSFAHQLDLYQAITAFKRALILAPSGSTERRLELQYDIILCYYLGKKYNDVIETFETSDLRTVGSEFPARHDLYVILYDCYVQTNKIPNAQRLLNTIHQTDSPTAEKLFLSTAVEKADIPTLDWYSKEHPENTGLEHLLTSYESQKKSVAKAQGFNALMPGAGYLYLGQKQSAMTALLLNGLFIAASIVSFDHHQVAAGIIFAGFEAGWYFGGIYGAGLEAKLYNERVYERNATPFMTEQKLFPVLMLNYAF